MKINRGLALSMILWCVGSTVLIGCVKGDPLIPAAIYQSANESDRDWAYKATWQDTRALNAAIQRDETNQLDDFILLLTARLQRLEQGKANAMSDPQTAAVITRAESALTNQDNEASLERLAELGKQIQDHFDAGDFEAAKNAALETLVITRLLAE